MTSASFSFSLACAASLALAVSATAQATYVDAVAGGNTTLADGTPFVPNLVTSGSDNNWTERVFANGATIYESNGQNVTGAEDAPMLRTTISGLAPGLEYIIYGYFWTADNATWRGRVLVSASMPSPELPGYIARRFTGSGFEAMRPLAVGAPLGSANFPSLDLAMDANNNEASGHFLNTVLIQEGNRWLHQAALGVHTADPNGDIFVYVDDLANNRSNNRTWYDGVGYEMAPFHFGSGCGTPTAPVIDYTGHPVINDDFSIELSGAVPSAACTLLIGLSNTSWNGTPLPFDLTPIGFPSGCLLNVSIDAAVPGTTSPTGDLSFPMALTGNFSASIFWQWIVLVPGASSDVSHGLQTFYHR